MIAQAAKAGAWTCGYCGAPVPSGYAHKCLEYDKRVTFYEGRPLPPIAPVAVVRDAALQATASLQHGALLAAWGPAQIAAHHAYLQGWHAGFAAASGIETEGHDREDGHGAEHESPVAESETPDTRGNTGEGI